MSFLYEVIAIDIFNFYSYKIRKERNFQNKVPTQ